jgi:hypothetical protein
MRGKKTEIRADFHALTELWGLAGCAAAPLTIKWPFAIARTCGYTGSDGQ